MYFWKTHLLANDLKKSSLGETDFKNYYLATSILSSVCMYVAFLVPRENMPALATEAVGVLALIVVGLNAVFRANGGATGTRFVEKVVAISFPLLIRVFVAGLAIGLLVGTLEIVGMSKCQTEWVSAIAIVAIQGVFFWRLVVHVRRANA